MLPKASRISGFEINAYRHLVGHLGRRIGPSQGLYLHRITQTQNRHVHSLNRKWDSNPRSQWSSWVEDITRYRPCSHCALIDLSCFCNIIIMELVYLSWQHKNKMPSLKLLCKHTRVRSCTRSMSHESRRQMKSIFRSFEAYSAFQSDSWHHLLLFSG
jgi:hypothetical protein